MNLLLAYLAAGICVLAFVDTFYGWMPDLTTRQRMWKRVLVVVEWPIVLACFIGLSL